MWIKRGFIAALLVGLAVTGWKSLQLEAALATERHAHEQTRTALDLAITEGQRWILATDAITLSAEAQKVALESCLNREAQAQTDAQARKKILNSAKPRPRLETETKQVVDDETRARIASRLNRDL